MRMLSSDDLRMNLQTIGNTVPKLVMQYVLDHPGCRWERPVVAISGVISPPIQHTTAQALVDESIHWFIGRSDLYVARGRRIWPIPPTLVWSAKNDAARAVFIGSLNQSLLDGLQASSAIDIKEQQVASQVNDGVIGVHYSFSVQQELMPDVRRHASDLGFEHVALDELAGDLSAFDHLLRPATGPTSVLDLPTGIWELYDPGRGWRRVEPEEWAPEEFLCRYVDDLEGRKSYRRFLRALDGQLTEVGWEEASMWQFYLDGQNGGATAILDDEKLLLEHPLPADVTLWMTGLECWPTG